MFKIKFRIVDDLEILKTVESNWFDANYNKIEGFIEVCFGQHKEGCYYHEGPLQEGEIGGELLNYWIDKLLDVANMLQTTSYCAFKEIETTNRWLEFKLVENKVTINVAIDTEGRNKGLLIAESYDGFQYAEPVDFSVELNILNNEIRFSVKRFLAELEKINPKLLKSQMVSDIAKKGSQIQHHNERSEVHGRD